MVKYSKRKAPKKRVSRKVRCKRGGMLRSLSKGLASVVRSGRSTKGCKVKSQSKEKIKNKIKSLLDDYKLNKIDENKLIVDIDYVKKIYLNYCEGLDQLNKLKLTNKKKDNEKILENTIKWIEPLITPLSYIQEKTERERSERRSKKGRSRRTKVKSPSPLRPNTVTASASKRSVHLTQELLKKTLPDHSPKRTQTNSLTPEKARSGPTLMVPENPKHHFSEKRPAGTPNQTPTTLTSSALNVHNEKQSQIYRG